MNKYKFDKKYENVLLIIASYGIIQVLAQDLGIKTGKKQRDLIQKIPIQIILFYSTSYLLTRDIYISIAPGMIYFILKYIYSYGQTSNVCFEEI